MEEFEELLYVRGYLRRRPERKRIEPQPLDPFVIPNDCRHPLSPKSFEENFRRMGFPRRRP